eukprot:gene18616-24347_t
MGNPENKPLDFLDSKTNDSWKNISVPSHWQLQGYDIPIYTNSTYPFPCDPPFARRTGHYCMTACDESTVSGQESLSTYTQLHPKELGYNTTGFYKCKFHLPIDWLDNIENKKLFITFDGVDSCLSIWLNGEYVGYGQDFACPNEFEITDIILSNNNDNIHTLSVQVSRWSDGSYLEDQDKWWLSGIYRDVYITIKPKSAHYPTNPRWLDICDESGLYLVDEANIETHGFQLLGQPVAYLSNQKQWESAMMSRLFRMVERDKNHCSIIIWSLGNESGAGFIHIKMSNLLRKRDPSRYIQYESGGARSAATDIICPMYQRPKWCREQAVNDSKKRPVILCEYAHAMNNSCGVLKKYWDDFRNDSYPRLQGGFIWDMVDQGLIMNPNYVDDNEIIKYGYGGDFGDIPNSKQFCCNGIFGADRFPHPSAYEANLCIDRANTDNDSGGMMLSFSSRWKASGIDCYVTKPMTVKLEKYNYDLSSNSLHVIVSVILYPKQKVEVPFELPVTYEYLFNSDGSINISISIKKPYNFPPLPRFGLRFSIPSTHDNVKWFGLGPYESYPDRTNCCRLGKFESKVNDLHTPYIVPQENGRRSEPRWISFEDNNNKLLVIPNVTLKQSAFDLEPRDLTNWGFNASYYSLEHLRETSHNHDLTPSKDNRIFVHIDSKTMGVGGYDSWFRNIDEEYVIDNYGSLSMSVLIRPLDKDDEIQSTYVKIIQN